MTRVRVVVHLAMEGRDRREGLAKDTVRSEALGKVALDAEADPEREEDLVFLDFVDLLFVGGCNSKQRKKERKQSARHREFI